MLERYGIVTRETVLAEGVPGGFSSLYGELSNLEMLGTARRGYFVEGLGGAQFALAGAVERLRGLPQRRGRVPDPRRHRPGPALRRRAAPGRSAPRAGARRAPPGAFVLLRDGNPIVYVERGGKGIVRLVELEGEELVEAVAQLAEAAREKRDPEARDRAGRRRAGDRLRARGADHRRRLQPPAAQAGRRGLRRCPRATRSTARPRGMNAALGGREIELAEAPNPRSPLHHRAAELQGRTLERAEARGKHLLVHFSGGARRPQPPRHERQASGRSPPTDACPTAGRGCAGVGPRDRRADRRQAAAPDVSETRARNDPALRQLGPDPLRPGFDVAAAARAPARARPRPRDRRRAARPGDHRRDRQRDPERGLFRARISPWRKVDELADDELELVVAENERVMRSSIAKGRRPRSIYRATGGGCPRCGGPISSRGQGDDNRTAYWCPRCQG